jgi:predicted LPLAT superfamily acyltransferase
VSIHWRQRPEGGGFLALWLIRFIALHGGRSVARVVLYPVTLYFFLRRGYERRCSRDFLTRALGRRASPWQVLRHLHCFASVILDRVFMLARGEDRFRIEAEGVDVLDAHLGEGRGVLLMGSHLGSFEALRLLSRRHPDARLRVVLDKQQAPALTALLDALAPDIGAGVIDGSQDPASVVLAMGEAAGQGHMIGLMADRGHPGEAMRRVPFLDAPASFPLGPWLLAATLRIPVMLCFGLYLGGNRYKLVFEAFADPGQLPRRARGETVDNYVCAYAQRLDEQARAHPYNWFNFYDFWHDPTHLDGPGAGAGRDGDVGPGA